ncbi:MAG: hypothetical protein HS111_29205 [Kofleriaceae bacterium]|nr:hypothetical protein [Kofleriaceae bacterium]
MFTAIAEDSVVELVTGGQGADMIVAALRLTGTGVGDCVAQRTRLEQPDGDLISSEEAPLVVRPAGDGRHVTGDLLLIYYGGWGQQARIRARGRRRPRRGPVLGGDRGEVDAATADAPILDAAPDAAPDATADDARAGRLIPSLARAGRSVRARTAADLTPAPMRACGVVRREPRDTRAPRQRPERGRGPGGRRVHRDGTRAATVVGRGCSG